MHTLEQIRKIQKIHHDIRGNSVSVSENHSKYIVLVSG